MRLHEKILISCVCILTVLFADGVWFLSTMGGVAKVKSENQINPTRMEETGDSREPVPERPVNIVVFGLDGEEVRSDVIVLLNFNPGDGRLNILSIARDTKVNVKGRSSKINALIAMGGEKMAINKVEELTGLTVDYYLTLNFKGFRKVIDALGGVEFEVPFDMNYDDPEQNLHIHLKKGKQILDGGKAEQFVRYRKGNYSGQGYTDGDIGRIKAQQEFMRALIKQKARLRYLDKVDDIFFILKKYMKTNIEMGDVNRYLKYLRNIRYEEITAYTLPGDSAYINKLWYFICDREKTRQLIESSFFK